MSLSLVVHRGTQQIGGSCIEITHPDGTRLVLDAGRPLDAPQGTSGLLPASLDVSRPATVLISHPHQDHYGLVDELPAEWPVWTGAASARLIALTSEIGGIRRRAAS
ncbi:MBL fold metallo-hydrolase [Methylobacterium oryzae CBMB20]